MTTAAAYAPALAFAVIALSTATRWVVVGRRIGRQPVLIFRKGGRQRAVAALFGLALAILIAAAVSIAARPPALAAEVRFAGALLCAAGAMLVVVAQVQMGRAWRVGVAAGDAPYIVATGLFRVSRNPIYLGMLLLGFGTALASGRSWAWLAFGLEVLAVRATVELEERHLAASFGESYATYCRSVRRWL
jgi:protein-S-isoprenylcysteine O-methyltransferase Ste14